MSYTKSKTIPTKRIAQYFQSTQILEVRNLVVVLPLADYGSNFGSKTRKLHQFPNQHLLVQSMHFLLQYISKLESYTNILSKKIPWLKNKKV